MRFVNVRNLLTDKAPLVSIVTPTFNRGGTIARAIESVAAQGLENYEHIIVDGKSSDKTEEIVSRYSNIRFISEADRGMYDAINKGIKIARGKYIGWLNSDDNYEPNSLSLAIKMLIEAKDVSGIFGAARTIFMDDSHPPQLIPVIQQGSILHRVAFDTFPINAFIFKREVFDQIGCFNSDYKIAADRDFMFRFGLSGIPFITLDRVLYVYCAHPSSMTLGTQPDLNIQGHYEEMDIAIKNREGRSSADKTYQLCTNWHKRASRDAALRILRTGDHKAFAAIMRQGLSVNKDWLYYFFGTLVIRVFGRFLPQHIYDRINKHT